MLPLWGSSREAGEGASQQAPIPGFAGTSPKGGRSNFLVVGAHFRTFRQPGFDLVAEEGAHVVL